ncbi:MAG: SUMF1/EgtB/PvdO family nonheme iron enzyme [Rhodopirellula sp.]|nr:SUMF1/EgtB/PvdO family nonheme iron enzyme [Rhodopirellula sp.]
MGKGTDPGRVIAHRPGSGPCLGIIREIGPHRPAVIGESLAKDILGDDSFDDGMEVVDLSGRYEIEEVIGQGGMGQVLKAFDTRLKRPVAIKRVLGKLSGSRKALQRFLTEAQSVAALNHFNIVAIHDYGRDKDGPFLILEYVDGVSLSQRLKDGPLELQDAVEMTTQLSAALTVAHRRGIVHRDVKPANVLLTEDGIPKLTDFGLARHESQQGENTRTGAVLGTPDFMAPEQREDSSKADAFSDQWSLAATFYQMVTGESPRIINGETLPISVRDVVLRALKTKPGKRYPTLQEFCDELQAAVLKQQTATFDMLQLKEGQCGSCGEINDTSRKFCRDCGESLELPCLKCGAGSPVWERFCGQCGMNIPEAVERELEAGKQLKSDLRTLVQEYRHQEAIEKLVPWLTIRHPALKSFHVWAVKANERLQRELAQLLLQRDEQLGLAKEYFDQARYSKALKGLATIPNALHTENSRQFREEVSALKNELVELAGSIRELSSARDYDALHDKLTRFLELKPGDEKAIKMQQRLLRRANKHAERNIQIKTEDSFQDEAEEYGKHYEYVARRRPARSSRTRNSGACLTLPSRRFLVTAGVAGLVAVIAIVTFLPTTEESTWLPEQTISDSRNDTSVSAAAFPSHKAQLSRSISELGAVPAPSSSEALVSEPELLAPEPKTATRKEPGLAMTPTASKQSVAALDSELTNSIGMKLRFIPAGGFMMGSAVAATELEKSLTAASAYFENSLPQHTVQITQPNYIQTTEVTQGQWEAVMGTKPWAGKKYVREGSNYAASYVTWHDAVEFCRTLSAREGATYRLPTEAEWEYACRAGSQTAYSFGDDAANLKNFGWFRENALDDDEQYAHIVGALQPNKFGLYDMHGNVEEWCGDWYDENYYKSSPEVDPSGPPTGDKRVARSGTWFSFLWHCRSAFRNRHPPKSEYYTLGFRVLREITRGSARERTVVAMLPLSAESSQSNEGKPTANATSAQPTTTSEGASNSVTSTGSTQTNAVSAKAELICRYDGHPTLISCFAFSQSDKIIASAPYIVTQKFDRGNSDDGIRVWNIDSGELVVLLNREFGNIHQVHFSPDGKYLVSASNNGLHLWNVASAQLIGTFGGHTDWVTSAAFSNDGRRVVSTGRWDHTARIWDARSGRELTRFMGHSGNVVWDAAFCHSGKHVISCGGNGTVYMWDAVTGRVLRRFADHSESVWRVCTSRDDKRLFSSGGDPTNGDDFDIRVWDLDRGNVIRNLIGHTHTVSELSVSSDGRRVLSTTERDGTILWDADTGRIIKRYRDVNRASKISADGQRALFNDGDCFVLRTLPQ